MITDTPVNPNDEIAMDILGPLTKTTIPSPCDGDKHHHRNNNQIITE